MSKPKYEFIIEAVHRENGRVAWVRGYRRRFVHYSDREILSRGELIRWLVEGKAVAVGQRRPLMGNDFDIQDEVVLLFREGKPWLGTASNPQGERELEGVPEV